MSWNAYDNDDGAPDCMIVAVANAISLLTGTSPSQDQVTEAYQKFCPGGCDPQTVLYHWLIDGIAGHHIRSMAKLSSMTEVGEAIDKFGFAILSMDLFGGVENHAILAIAHDFQGLTVVSWGKEMKLSWLDYASGVSQAYTVSETIDPWVTLMELKNDWRLWVFLAVVIGVIYITANLL